MEVTVLKVYSVLVGILMLFANLALASSDEAWEALDQEVIATCLKGSGLWEAKPVGDVIHSSDNEHDTLVVSGHYQGSNAKNTVLCQFNRKTITAAFTEISGPHKAKAVAVNSEQKTDFSFWQITLMIILGVWFLKTANRAIKRAARRHKQEQAEKDARLAQEEYQRNQNAIARARALSNISELVSNSQLSAAKLPLILSDAEFSEGVYSPFWEAMEGAVQSLSEFNKTIRFIEAAQQRHALEAPPLAPDAVSFSLGVRVLPNPSATNQRMKALYRKAQKDPHFAQIYEQRRTNAILIEGFRSLGDALIYLGDRIESELRSLGDTIAFRLSDIESSIRESSKQMERQHEELLQTAQSWREEARSGNDELAAIARSNAENAERSAKERRDMLDNIQHRRKPLWGGGGDY